MFGPRPSHYGLAILGAMIGGMISADQVRHYIVPESGSYGNAIFGLHLYTWSLVAFATVVVGSGVMLLFDRQFGSRRAAANAAWCAAPDGGSAAYAACRR